MTTCAKHGDCAVTFKGRKCLVCRQERKLEERVTDEKSAAAEAAEEV
jgi:hypothetical protein